MGELRRLWQRLASVFRPRHAEDDLARDVAAHLQLLEDHFASRGLPPDAARAAAKRAFGGVEQAKERHRDVRSFRWLDDARRDIGYAARSLSHNPGFTTSAILTLALGIGAATAIYSVVDTILLQPLPFRDADRLVRLIENDRPAALPRTSYQEYLEWRSRTTTLSDIAATTGFDPQMVVLTPAGTARLTTASVTANYFDLLGAHAHLGRTLHSTDQDSPDVAVLSFETWSKHFGRDPKVIGAVVPTRPGTPEARSLTVVGVLPDGMEHLGVPLDLYAVRVDPPGGRPSTVASMIGRLRDGTSVVAATEEASALGNALRPPRPASAPPLTAPRFEARPLKDDVVASSRPALRILVAAAVVLLLIVCANVANLLLARGTARGREIAVRMALGASRGRIARQILTECLLLASIGGVCGATLGAAGIELVKALATVDADGVFRILFGASILPRAAEVRVDVRLIVAAVVLGAATSILFGCMPALRLSRANYLEAMGPRSGGPARRDTRLRMALVVAQLTLATTLLVGAALLSNSFVKLLSVDKGYDPANVLAFQLVLPDEYATVRKRDAIEAILARLRAMPDVAAAGFAYSGILVSIQNTVGWFVPPRGALDAVKAEAERPRLKSISPGYLEAVSARVLEGRLMTETDRPATEPAVVINRNVARRYFGQSSAVGSFMDWYGGRGAPIRVRIVGVIDDIRQASLDRQPYAEIFMDYREVIAVQERWGTPKRNVDNLAIGFASFAMRTRGEPQDAIVAVRGAVASVDSNIGIDAILPLTRLVAGSLGRQRFYAVTVGIFAAVAAVLAAIGIYGVLAYAVVQRTREIGVRVALGATRSQVVGLVLGRGLMLTAIGVGLGLMGAAAGSRYLQGMLFEITPLDLRTFAAVALGFTAVAALASYLPARRATRVDPMVALRSE
jgi:predicted permease